MLKGSVTFNSCQACLILSTSHRTTAHVSRRLPLARSAARPFATATMAPPKSAHAFIDFVNASPTRKPAALITHLAVDRMKIS